MAKVQLTEALRAEYQSLFDRCQIKTSKAVEVDRLVSTIIGNKPRYAGVGDPFGIPWSVIAIIHHMECSQNFDEHLHNGDPLTARTIHEPCGRPSSGNPPFTWEGSAADALAFEGLTRWKDWSVPGILYSLEGYNGWGYRLYHPDVKSPYLWSGSNHYVSGKYVADGTWSESAVSRQCGAATLLRRIAEKGQLAAEPHVADIEFANFSLQSFKYAPGKVIAAAIELQRFLNRFPGIYLKEDGTLGDSTSEACKRVFGRYLLGDPRNR
jgi:lysozyme family protein